MIISSMQKRQSLNEYTVNITVDGIQVNQTTFSKSRGLNIDDNLSWSTYMTSQTRVSSSIGVIKQVRPLNCFHAHCI